MGNSSSNKPPRKKRTRSHVIADWSVHHVEWYVLNEGWAAERVFRDYGFDLTITTFDQRGYAEAGPIQMQLKATEKIGKYRLAKKDVFSFSITRADFNLWTETVFPVFFVLYDAVNEVAYWQYVQKFFENNPPKRKGTSNLQLHIPRQNVVDSSTMTMMRNEKTTILRRTKRIQHV